MSNDLTPREYISAKEASRILRVSERQVNYYGHNGQLRTMRAGRRVLYHRSDVERLAATLQVDIRPQQLTRQDVNEELIRYVQGEAQRNQEFLEGQRQLSEGQRGIADRLQRIEERLDQPQRGPSWQTIATLAIVLAIGLVVLAIVLRIF